jgi:D-alanyl-D-alanine carboxypeptidase/D-alanyl-D-alanine-endopeptidase (penicillin-binding protein 4)
MIWGEIQIDAEPDEDSVSVEDPSRWAGEILRKALKERGIRVGGSVEVRRISPAEASAQDFAPSTTPRVVLAERLSAPLSEDIKIINKSSHNLHVEMLLRTLGKELNAQGSSKAGIEVLENFVKDIGIEEDEAVFADGSGLSRHSLIAPRATIKLLKFMSKSPRFPAFLDSLPIAGEDGTLDDRFVRTSARGRIRAKTGTLEHVNALAGYMDMLSVMGNEHPMRAYQGKRVVDRITVTIFEHFGGRRKAKRL